jgi:flavin-dependent dehydrogenase
VRPSAVDVAIVGGGPVGLAAAIGLRLAGFTVGLLDRGRPPQDKACGEGLMPDGVKLLAALGVELDSIEARPFYGVRYLDQSSTVEGRFPGAPGLGIRRTRLHRLLADRAAAAGVELHWGASATGLSAGVLETSTGAVAARWIVGADGLHSSVRRWIGLSGERRPRARRPDRFGVRRHFAIAPWTDLVEVHWTRGCEAYVTPVGPNEVGVALLWGGAPDRFERLLERFPRLRARLGDARPCSRERGAGPFRQEVRAVCAGNVALIGDAAGYLDAITGEGLAVGFHQAAALVEALRAGDLRHYARAHRRISRLPYCTTLAVLLLAGWPRLRARALRLLAARPALFSMLLGIHARQIQPWRLAPRGARG